MRFVFFIALALMFSSCATTYQKQGFSGGYWDTQLSKDMFEVGFSGNGYTGASTVRNYFLKRCAEVTRENGFRHFVIIDGNQSSTAHNLGTTTTGNISPNYYGGYNYSQSSQTTTVYKSARSGTIKLFKDGEQPPTAIDADVILSQHK